MQAYGLAGGVSSGGYGSQLGYSSFSGMPGGGLLNGGLDGVSALKYGDTGGLGGSNGSAGALGGALQQRQQQQREVGGGRGSSGALSGLGGSASAGGVASVVSGSPGLSAADALLSLSALSLSDGISSAVEGHPGLLHPAIPNGLQVITRSNMYLCLALYLSRAWDWQMPFQSDRCAIH